MLHEGYLNGTKLMLQKRFVTGPPSEGQEEEHRRFLTFYEEKAG
jgi:hypothetical protein